MKKFALLMLIVLSCKISAQEETLLSGKIVHGGFGGPEVKFTQFDGKFAVLVGGKGGWIINHTFVIGGAGYGLANQIDAKVSINNEVPYLNFGYGGLYLEYIQDWDKLLHYSFSALIGAGGISYRHRSDFWDEFDNYEYPNKTFFIIEPAANAEVNIASFFRISAGVSYRILSGLEFDGYTKQNMEGLSGILTFKFGKF